MINLNPDKNDSFEEYKSAVNRKKDATEKAELQLIEAPMKDCYINYEQHFERNDVEHMPQARIGQEHKNTLLSLYSPDTAIIKNFRQRYFARNLQSYYNRCPYCTINDANTTEHILPKEQYPEYAVDVLNLIPACSQCNSKKGECVLDKKTGKKNIINFYKDQLPKEQYLFVDFEVIGDEIKATYRLENKNNAVDVDTFALIERHFKQLGLLDRFNSKAMQETSELKNLYRAEGLVDESDFDAFAARQIRKLNLDRETLGYNYWRIILYYSAATSDVFKQYILSHYKLKK